MKRVSVALLAIVAGGAIVAFATDSRSQSAVQGPEVPAQQQPDRPVEPQQNPEQKQPSAAPSTAGVPERRPDTASAETQADSNQRGDEASEFWMIFNRSLKITDTLLVVFTFLLFLATLALWWSTRRLVRGADLTAERQLRAYVNISELRVIDLNNVEEGAVYLIEIVNYGRTPAYSVTTEAAVRMTGFPLDQELRLPDEPLAGRAVIGPRLTFHNRVPAGRPLTAIERNGLFKGEAAIFVFGRIGYLDVFGKRRETLFRYLVGGNVLRRLVSAVLQLREASQDATDYTRHGRRRNKATVEDSRYCGRS